MRVSKKQRRFVASLLGCSFALTALSGEYAENDEKAFKEAYGLSFDEAQKAIKAVVEKLSK